MKKLIFAFPVAIALVASLFVSCDVEEPLKKESTSILPENFKIDIPSAISSPAGSGSLKSATLASEDSAAWAYGVYAPLRWYIFLGQNAATWVDSLLFMVAIYDIDKPMDITYTSNNRGDDQRTKHLVVVENDVFEGITYQYSMTISDLEKESNADGGIGIQLFWSLEPTRGVAILMPNNINATDTSRAMYRIDYNDGPANGYDADMTVSISGIDWDQTDEYGCNALKMWAGRKGDVVDVRASSSHPNYSPYAAGNDGVNWAYVASGNSVTNIGVAELGLPDNTVDTEERDSLLGYFSVQNVFRRAILEVNPGLGELWLNQWLAPLGAPGFFDAGGFVQAGTKPSNDYDGLITNIEALTPFSPKSVNTLDINFKLP